MTNIISTWIYLDSPEESSEYPQVGKASHLPEFQKVYWRCVAVFFEMSVRNNPHCRHVLFSNVAENDLPNVDGLDLKRFLKDRHVALCNLPLTWQAPKGWHGKWRNQFYIFDVLNRVASDMTDDSALIVLDSDCIINQSLEGLFADIRKHGLMALPMGFDPAYNINGLTRRDMQQLFGELDGAAPTELPEYCGGEIFAATGDKIREINAMAPSIWQEMQKRFAEGKPKFNEEAHFLSYCYHKMGGYAPLNRYIKRIWTSPKFNNVRAVDFDLPVWHLPAEKTGGIALLFKRMTRYAGRQMVYNGREDLGGMLGVPKRTRYLNLKHFIKHTGLYKWLAGK
jgi:hypothetical protein